ncbi:predicted protein [Arabidopsis lyrata subsp. lyrata]|uniref:Predicted protein n=1 Tax=Arabidopsis lyrata subsp. lyrata TaxID=81972 RepID=D7LX69_ARALL|nr:predicted protein [Arabidopsis lyrata subsp. lyrata]
MRWVTTQTWWNPVVVVVKRNAGADQRWRREEEERGESGCDGEMEAEMEEASRVLTVHHRNQWLWSQAHFKVMLRKKKKKKKKWKKMKEKGQFKLGFCEASICRTSGSQTTRHFKTLISMSWMMESQSGVEDYEVATKLVNLFKGEWRREMFFFFN